MSLISKKVVYKKAKETQTWSKENMQTKIALSSTSPASQK